MVIINFFKYIFTFIHRIRMGIIRENEAVIPLAPEAKRYGSQGEDEFSRKLLSALPACKIKRNIMISTPMGDAEIDCLVLYGKKLFAIEVKRWRGRVVERDDSFVQSKLDRCTGEIHTKILGSPFKQLGRATFLLRQQIPVQAWVNSVVFFEGDQLESLTTTTDKVWFKSIDELIEHIKNNGNESNGTRAESFFAKCVSGDCLHTGKYNRSMVCTVTELAMDRHVLRGATPRESIDSIHIEHFKAYDKLHLTMRDGTTRQVDCDNAKVKVIDNGKMGVYALCKLDYIKFGA